MDEREASTHSAVHWPAPAHSAHSAHNEIIWGLHSRDSDWLPDQIYILISLQNPLIYSLKSPFMYTIYFDHIYTQLPSSTSSWTLPHLPTNLKFSSFCFYNQISPISPTLICQSLGLSTEGTVIHQVLNPQRKLTSLPSAATLVSLKNQFHILSLWSPILEPPN